MSAVRDMALTPAEERQTGLAPAEQMAATVQALAANPNVDVDKLEKIIALQQSMVNEQARREFNVAMSRAQQDIRRVAADAENPQTRSKYASYAALDRALRPVYTLHGFALSFGTEDSPLEQHVRVVCDVTHTSGHGKPYHVDIPADGKGARGNDVMTKTHAVGSALSYGMRYLLKLIFNVAVGEDDDDGNAAGQTAPKADPPTGYDTFLSSLAEAALDGGDALKAAWKDAPKAMRDYMAAHDQAKQKGYRAAADMADAKAKAKAS